MLTCQHIPSRSPLKKDNDVLEMGRSRCRVGVVSAPEMAPRKTPGERRKNVGKTPMKRQKNVDVEFASFIVDVVLFI